MKVIAQSNKDTFLVEMSVDEMARSAGFTGSFDQEWKKATYGDGRPVIGQVIKIGAAYEFHSRILHHQAQAKSAANTLHALAELIGGALPDIVIPPVPDFEEVTEAVL